MLTMFACLGFAPNCAKYVGKSSFTTLRALEGKWKIIIFCLLVAAKAPRRFSDPERLIEGINQKMLIQQLKQLKHDSIVQRTLYPQAPPRVEYQLAEMGHALGPSIQTLIAWAEMRREHVAQRSEGEDVTA